MFDWSAAKNIEAATWRDLSTGIEMSALVTGGRILKLLKIHSLDWLILASPKPDPAYPLKIPMKCQPLGIRLRQNKSIDPAGLPAIILWWVVEGKPWHAKQPEKHKPTSLSPWMI